LYIIYVQLWLVLSFSLSYIPIDLVFTELNYIVRYCRTRSKGSYEFSREQSRLTETISYCVGSLNHTKSSIVARKHLRTYRAAAKYRHPVLVKCSLAGCRFVIHLRALFKPPSTTTVTVAADAEIAVTTWR